MSSRKRITIVLTPRERALVMAALDSQISQDYAAERTTTTLERVYCRVRDSRVARWGRNRLMRGGAR